MDLGQDLKYKIVTTKLLLDPATTDRETPRDVFYPKPYQFSGHGYYLSKLQKDPQKVTLIFNYPPSRGTFMAQELTLEIRCFKS